MADVTFQIQGLKELEQALSQLPKATARNTLRKVLRKRAEPIRDAWKAKAPRQAGAEGGHLAGSIKVGSRLTRRQASQARKEGKDFVELYIGTSDPAGQQQEFGNVNHPAQPSARPVWDAMKYGTLDGIADDLASEIEKSRARLARKAARLAAKG